MLRPRPALWFRLLCPYEDLLAALQTLARTRGVEISASGDEQWQDRARVESLLERFTAFAERYGAYWPSAASAPPAAGGPRPLARAEAALAALQGWEAGCRDLIGALVQHERTVFELGLQLDWLQALARAQLDARLGLAPRAHLDARVLMLPAGHLLEPVPDTLHTLLPGAERDFVVVIGRSEQLDLAQQRAEQLHGRRFVPQPARAGPRQTARALEQRLAEARGSVATLRAELGQRAHAHQLPGHLGALHWLRWAWETGRGQDGTGGFGWITGWAERDTARDLAALLQRDGCRALVSHPPPPPGLEPPVILDNPRWAVPFEFLTRLYGVPGAGEADPSPVVGIVAPLLFGYMFGDVGQGLLILAAGLLWRRRQPLARIAIPCGISATAFGFVFGSVFGLEDLLPALWLHPLGAPQAVLLPPLVFGALLLVAGLLLDLLGAWWSGRVEAWWRTQGGVVLGFLTVLGLAQPPLGLLCLLGWCGWCAQQLHAAFRDGRPLAFLGELVEWFEQLLRLLVNTLSFARVGAFALAHAGLSLATVQLAAAIPWGPGQIVMLVLGNLVMLSLELLVVSIQTTRLLLFEFFIRFLRGQGRALRPLTAPRFT
ncbi:MAG TPA: hypothetical protein VIX81_10110 [Gammaproteobacteria bacterium]